MASDNHGRAYYEFGDFRLDSANGELRKHGMRIRLPQQSLRVLSLLTARPTEIVTREELRHALWSEDTFVDFEHGLNNCVKQIRAALNDDASSPRFIETIPKRGYRFVAPLERRNGRSNESAGNELALSAAELPPPALDSPAIPAVRSHLFAGAWVAVVACLLLSGGIFYWLTHGRSALSFHSRDSVLVTDFENHTGDPRFDQALDTAFLVSLQQSQYANVFPRARLESVLKRMDKSGSERITSALGSEICRREDIRGLITGSITRTGQQYALTAELLDPATGVPVRSYMERVRGEDGILDALDRIADHIRADLGESLYQIRRNEQPLPQLTTASLTALKQYADAKSLWSHGKFNDAVVLYRSAIGVDPDFAMAHAALGAAYCSHALSYQREQGEQEYKLALALSSRVSEREKLLIELGYARDLEHVEEANRLFHEYLIQYPDDWQIRLNYSRYLRRHGHELEAIEQYKELLRIAPDDASAYLEMATAYKTLANFGEALRAYSEAFRLDPDNLKITNVNREYGFTLIANGEAAKAEQVFSTLLAQPETRASGLHSLAMLDLLGGRYSSAAGRFEESLSLARQQGNVFLVARTHYFLAVVATGQGNSKKQIAELDAALSDFKELGPKVEYGSLVGQEYARLGALDKADKIVALITPLADPHSDEQTGYLRLLQGELALAKGHVPEALELLMLQDLRFGTSVNSLSMEALGHAYHAAGKPADAIAWYEKVLGPGVYRLSGWEPQERCATARVALASDYLALGNKKRADEVVSSLLNEWKNADPGLPLVKTALRLRSQTVEESTGQATPGPAKEAGIR